MKILQLLRHAKSSWTDTKLTDQQRPLNLRGIAACNTMARGLLATGCDFSHSYCSSATRAQMTLLKISEALPEQAIHWQVSDALYTFDWLVLLDWCRTLNDVTDSVLLVGHNPALTILTQQLTNEPLDNIATCGYVRLEIEVDCWQQLTNNTGVLIEYLSPKMISS